MKVPIAEGLEVVVGLHVAEVDVDKEGDPEGEKDGVVEWVDVGSGAECNSEAIRAAKEAGCLGRMDQKMSVSTVMTVSAWEAKL